MRNENHRRESNRVQPGEKFRHAEDHDGRWNLRAGRRDRERARAGGGELPKRPRMPTADWARRAADRGYVAIPLQGRLLAARADHDVRDRGGGYGAVGYQGKSSERAGISIVGRSVARVDLSVRARERKGH